MVQTLSLNALSWRQLFILLVGRWTLQTAFRVLYPLLPFLAGSFAIDARTASLLITVQVGANLASPLGGMLADRRGERETMVWGLGCFCLGTLLCALSSSFLLFVAGYGLVGLSSALYHPSAQAYASARTPYAQRGRILGILELSWAFAALIGVTALTQVANSTDSRTPLFVILLVLGVISLLTTHFGLDRFQHQENVEQHHVTNTIGSAALFQPHILGALGVVFGMILSAELIFGSYALWLYRDFGATVDQVGLVLALLGVAELIGSSGSALLVDRFGKRRSVLIGLLVSGIAQALLPLSSGNWPLFLVLFLIFDLGFEYALVSFFPLISGAVPQGRGTLLALSAAIVGLARLIGSLVGPLVWASGGFVASALLAAAVSATGLVIGLLWMREGHE